MKTKDIANVSKNVYQRFVSYPQNSLTISFIQLYYQLCIFYQFHKNTLKLWQMSVKTGVKLDHPELIPFVDSIFLYRSILNSYTYNNQCN